MAVEAECAFAVPGPTADNAGPNDGAALASGGVTGGATGICAGQARPTHEDGAVERGARGRATPTSANGG